jgi:cytochrome P450
MFRYQAINLFGKQIVSVQTGEEHRRHKGVVRSCFNEAVMENVFERMVEAYNVMIREETLEDGGVLKGAKEAMIKVGQGCLLLGSSATTAAFVK